MTSAVVSVAGFTLSADHTPSATIARNAAIAYPAPALCRIAYAAMIATSRKSVPKSSIGDDAGTGRIASAGKSNRNAGATIVFGIEVKCDSASWMTTNAAIHASTAGHAAGVYEVARHTTSTSAIVAPPSRCSHTGPRKIAMTE